MYEDHWGLTGHPFAPDPHCWFETAALCEAMAYLGHAIAQGEGFVLVTGDAGVGKTMMVDRLLRGREDRHVVHLTAADAADLLHVAAAKLGVTAPGLSPDEVAAAVERGLHHVARQGQRALLVVDDAHALPDAMLDQLRVISDVEAGGRSLTQIVLVGRSTLADRIRGTDALHRLRRRVIAGHHLVPWRPDEIAEYIACRLALVGWQGRPDWAADAFPALFATTGGMPRRIDGAAIRAMATAAATGRDLIDAATIPADRLAPSIDERIADLERRLQQQDEALRRVLRLLGDRAELPIVHPARAA